MMSRPSEQEQVDIIIKNLLPVYQQRLFTKYLPSFKALVATGTKIEDGLQNGQIKEEVSRCKPTFSGNKPYVRPSGSSSQNQRDADVSNIASQAPIRLAPRQPQRQQQQQPPARRTFTELPIPLSAIFKRAREQGLITPSEPRPVPNPLPRRWHAHERCEYHQWPGHKTDDCLNLRHKIQDLIDSGAILPPRPRPNINTNPLPKHQNINHLSDEEPMEDPSVLIKPIEQECNVMDLEDLMIDLQLEELAHVTRSGRVYGSDKAEASNVDKGKAVAGEPEEDPLLKQLKKTQVPISTTPDALVSTLLSTPKEATLSFTDKDLPSMGANHTLALYITVEAHKKTIPPRFSAK